MSCLLFLLKEKPKKIYWWKIPSWMLTNTLKLNSLSKHWKRKIKKWFQIIYLNSILALIFLTWKRQILKKKKSWKQVLKKIKVYNHPSWSISLLDEENTVKGSVSDVLVGCWEPEMSFSCKERLLFMKTQKTKNKYGTRFLVNLFCSWERTFWSNNRGGNT